MLAFSHEPEEAGGGGGGGEILEILDGVCGALRKPLPYFRPEWSKSLLCFRTKRLGSHTVKGSHIYIAYIGCSHRHMNANGI